MLTYWQTLIAKESNITVSDSYAKLWGKKSQSGYTVETYTGTLPATLTGTKAGYLESYKIYGNTVQDGTPTPENPIVPSGCGERTENLHNPETDVFGFINANGNISSSTLTKSTNFILCESGFHYVLRIYKTGTLQSTNQKTVDFYASDKSYIRAERIIYVLNDDEEYRNISFVVPTGAGFLRFSYDIGYSKSMLNLDSTALPYEPYGYKLPLTVNGVEYPIYLGGSQTTRKIKKLVLTGEEDCTISESTASPGAYCYVYTYSNLGMTDIIYNDEVMSTIPYPQYVCSHFKMKSSPKPEQNDDYFTKIRDGEVGANTTRTDQLSRNRYIILCSSQYTTIESFKSFLAAQYANGTPVTVWYVLAEPETGIVNEPLMKIGNYADTIDSTQTDVQIPTTAGETTISWAGEGLAPSEVEFVYKVKG